jgi:hypothetical protein
MGVQAMGLSAFAVGILPALPLKIRLEIEFARSPRVPMPIQVE